MDRAWRLNDDARFRESFRSTVARLSNRSLTAGVYAAALNKMVINHADTSRDPRIVADIRADAAESQRDRLYKPAPAYSFRDGNHLWIRTFGLEQGERKIATHIFHEAAHLVGAPGDPLAEIALDAIHQAAGLPR